MEGLEDWGIYFILRHCKRRSSAVLCAVLSKLFLLIMHNEHVKSMPGLPWPTPQRPSKGRGWTGRTREREVRQNRLHPDSLHEEETEPQVRHSDRHDFHSAMAAWGFARNDGRMRMRNGNGAVTTSTDRLLTSPRMNAPRCGFSAVKWWRFGRWLTLPW